MAFSWDKVYNIYGMPLREMDKVIYPVCKLCRNHEQVGFIEGIKVGMRLEQELTKE